MSEIVVWTKGIAKPDIYKNATMEPYSTWGTKFTEVSPKGIKRSTIIRNENIAQVRITTGEEEG